ncbi:acyltransferase-domain-containing protein [Hyaloraphidium curvatum]|nr:acyltransferase-domain-containing protein [Hyaloraphidium curvatum]
MAAFLSLLTGVSIAINVIQFPALFLLQPFSRHYYREWMSVTEAIFGALMVLLTSLFAPATIRLSVDSRGTWDAMTRRDAKNVLISNHQALVDWWYLWIVAHQEGKHGDFKIILKESLKFLPVFGWGMWFFEFIFLKRKWAFDKLVLEKATRTIKEDTGIPCWLLIFPEGKRTVNDPPGVTASKAYAKKIDLSYPYRHVILPKSTGLFYILRQLKVGALYDLTMAYPRGRTGQVMEDYPIDKVFFEGEGPKTVDVHLRKFDVADVPGISDAWQPPAGAAPAGGSPGDFDSDPAEKMRHEAFTLWLRDRFMEKDLMMEHYAQKGKFPDAIPVVKDLAEVAGAAKAAAEPYKMEVPAIPTLVDVVSIVCCVVFSYTALWRVILWSGITLKSVTITLSILGAIAAAIMVGTGTLQLVPKKEKKLA